MTDDEKMEYVTEHFLEDAIKSIEEHRRYWNPTISRTMTKALATALENSGFPVFAWELPPQWEHVFFLKEDVDVENRELKQIAERRYEMMEDGVEDDLLPN